MRRLLIALGSFICLTAASLQSGPDILTAPAAYLAEVLQKIRLNQALEQVPAVYPDVMAIDLGGDGSVWVTGKYTVTRIPVGNPGKAETILDSRRFRALFGRPMEALSSAYIEGETAWFGSWYGQVYRLAQGTWTQLADGRQTAGSRVRDILRFRDTLYFAANGLWRLGEPDQKLHPVDLFDRVPVKALAAVGEELLIVAVSDELWAWDGVDWRLFWHNEKTEREILAVAVLESGGIMVGTHDGYIALDRFGGELYRDLAGVWVTGFATTEDGDLWIATWDQGFQLHAGGRWKNIGYTEGLRGDSLSALVFDHAGHLWLGLYGQGAFVADRVKLQEAAADSSGPDLLGAPRLFTSACEAALAVDARPAESGQVAVENIDGEIIVYFDQEQVCPRGIGFRAGTGSLLRVGETSVDFLSENRRSILPLPMGMPAGAFSAAYIDFEGRPWLGSHASGLFVRNAEDWHRYGPDAELEGNPVTSIVEDHAGNLWVGTLPPIDRQTHRHKLAGLHRFDGERWQHLRPPEHPPRAYTATDGGDALPAPLTNEIRVLADGAVLIATNGGYAIYDNGQVTSYTRTGLPGMPSSFVHSISEDSQGVLWVAHGQWGQGISWRSGPLWRNLNSRDGLFADYIDRVAHDAEGRIWLLDHSGRVAVYDRQALIY